MCYRGTKEEEKLMIAGSKSTAAGVLILTGLYCLIGPGSGYAQGRGAEPPAAPAPDPRLDALLTRWERETSQLHSMLAEVVCTRKYNSFTGQTEVLVGSARFMRPDLARIDLRSKDNPERYERYICTGTHIYRYVPEEKVIEVYPLPARRAHQLPDDGPLPFLFGMSAETAKKRYRLRISKEDEWYTYVEVTPLYERDMVEFTRARIVILNRPTAAIPKDMPRELYWIEPNRNEHKYDIQRIQMNAVAVQRTDFIKPNLPPGWTWRIVQPQEAPSGQRPSRAHSGPHTGSAPGQHSPSRP
ncbi:MAG: hypothetical protein C4297_08030 [Gemmataceae bacterium]